MSVFGSLGQLQSPNVAANLFSSCQSKTITTNRRNKVDIGAARRFILHAINKSERENVAQEAARGKKCIQRKKKPTNKQTVVRRSLRLLIKKGNIAANRSTFGIATAGNWFEHGRATRTATAKERSKAKREAVLDKKRNFKAGLPALTVHIRVPLMVGFGSIDLASLL